MLLECPECNGQVSDKATACPHCGAPVKTMKVSSGIFGIVGRWLAEKREKSLEKERLERERLDKLNAEKKAEQERQAKLEYKRNFSYSSKPYWESCYDGLDCAKIRKDLCLAASYQDVLQALSPFQLAQDGYFANLPWLKEWASLDPMTRTLDVLYVSFCMSDQTTCDSLIKAGYVLNKDLACKALVKLAAKNVDERTLAFIDRYVDFSTDNLSYYQSHIRWLPILDSKPDIIPFYTRFGIEPKIGDEGLAVVRRGHLLSGRTGANVAQIYSSSPLLKALDDNDISRVKFLLKWGANPNQWMFCCYRCDAAAGPNPSVSHADPLLCHIRSAEAFKLMTDAGMDWYPCSKPDGSSIVYNLIEELWRGECLTGDRLKLIDYLYKIGYDKPLRAKQDYYRGVVDEKDTSYEKNVDHIRRWLSALPQRD